MDLEALGNNWVQDQRLLPICTSVSFNIEQTFWNNFPNPRVIVLFEFSDTELVLKEYPAMVSIEDGSGNMIVASENDGDRVRIADRLFSNLCTVREKLNCKPVVETIEKIIYKLYVGDMQLTNGETGNNGV